MYKIKNYNRTELLEENIFTLIWRYSLPATTGMLVNASFNIIDTIFVGFLGSEAIAALSVSFPVQMLMGGIAIGTAVGASSLISRQLGAAEYEEANKTASQAFSLALLLSLIIVFIGTFYLKDMIAIFGATPEIFSATCEYLSVILWGAPTVFLMMMSNNIIRGEGNPVMSMKIMIAGAVLNIILDPIFIFAFSLGIRGAALATVIARTLVLFYVAYYYLSGKSLIRISARWFILRWKIVYEIYRVGISAIFMQIAINLATIFVNRILGDYDYLGIAALGIITVSYTHLDVYKRQLYNRLKNENRLTMEKWWLNPNYKYGMSMIVPKNMTETELEKGAYMLRSEFYSYKSIIQRLANNVNRIHPLVFLMTNLVSRREIHKKQGVNL